MNIFKKLNKKQIIIISFLLVIIFTELLLFLFLGEFRIIDLKEKYSLDEITKTKLSVGSNILINKSNTVWNINGYDFYKGKTANNIPVVLGENVLKITNGSNVKEYTFTITNDDDKSKALVIPYDTDTKEYLDYLDFDGDGISNKEEVEKNLSTYSDDSDGDGLFDNVELIMGLDPLKKDDYNKVREFTMNKDNKELSDKNYQYVIVKGKGNIANTFLDSTELSIGLKSKFVKSDIVSLSTSNNEEATYELHFSKENKKKEQYAIYGYNENNDKLEKIEIEEDENTFYALVKADFSKYFLGLVSNEPELNLDTEIMFLIDNSGSMYSREFLEEKNKRKYTDEEVKDVGNDIEFNRISLMEELVKELGTDDYSYITRAFTGNTCDITPLTKDQQSVIDGLESIKTTCQNFNGTDLSNSIYYSVNKFDDVIGKKFLIVLTDGHDEGWLTFKLSDYHLNNIKESGVNVVTIGLGNVDSAYLQEIAEKTDGLYLYANDSDMLEKLIDLLKNGIKKKKVNNEYLIADSGFRSSVDGFSFENFSSSDDIGKSGNCYGFSLVAKRIYTNTLSYTGDDKEGILYTMNAYDLSENNRNRLVKGNVYNIRLHNDYDIMINSDSVPDGYRYDCGNNKSCISDTYKDKLGKMGYKISVKDGPKEFDGKVYDKFESSGKIRFTYDAYVSDEYKDDYDLLKLINRGQNEQATHLLTAIYTSLSEGMRGSTVFESNIEPMISEISSGSPAIVSMDSSVGGHALLATSIYRSIDYSKYRIMIYDSNVPGVDSEATLTRIVDSNPNSGMYKYKFEYEGAGITFTSISYANIK